MRGVKLDIKPGRKFGKLTILDEKERRKFPSGRSSRVFLCLCECGDKKSVQLGNLSSGQTVSCGTCSGTIHGKSGDMIYNIWSGIKARCGNPNEPAYKWYGARGIKMNESWKLFENFYRDVGDPPTKKHSIDRIDNEGNYEPGNVRWATMRVQNNNRRNNTIIEYRGQSYTMAELCRKIGMKPSTFCVRLRNGWTVEKIVSTPVRKHKEYTRESSKQP